MGSRTLDYGSARVLEVSNPGGGVPILVEAQVQIRVFGPKIASNYGMIKFEVGAKYWTRAGQIAICLQTDLDRINNDNRFVARVRTGDFEYCVNRVGIYRFDQKKSDLDVICLVGEEK